MFDSAARIFLQERLIARLATIGPDGYPHNIPIWYMLDGEDIVFISDRGTRKTKNALANPKGAVAIGGDMADAAGYLIRGDIVIETDVDHAVTHRIIDRYEDAESGAALKEEWKNDDIVVIRLKAKSVLKVR